MSNESTEAPLIADLAIGDTGPPPARQIPSAPPTLAARKTYYLTALKLAIILSAFLLLLLSLGPFSSPLAGPFFQSFITGLLFVSNITSLVFYSTVVREQVDLGNRRRALILGLVGLTGVAVGILLCIAMATTVMNGILIVAFTGGSFLSFACRMDPNRGNQRETTAAYIIFFIAVLLAVFLAIGPISAGLTFLNSLSALTAASKWGFYPVVSAILASVGFAQYVTKAFSITNTPAERSKYWENLLTALSFLISLVFCLLVFVNLYPLGSIGLKIVLSIMICTQCASLASKLGKAMDETMTISTAKTFILKQATNTPSVINVIVEHPLWVYIARPLAIAGLFLMLGFALLASSPLAVISGLSLSSFIMISMAALALGIIANLVMRWLHPTAINTPTCQAISSAAQAHKILERLLREDMNENGITSNEINHTLFDALRVHVIQATKLLSTQWRSSLISYGENTLTPAQKDKLVQEDFNQLEGYLKAEAQLKKQELQQLKRIFKNLTEAEIDLSYRPNDPAKTLRLLFLAGAAGISFLALLFAIFAGLIPVAGLAWSMSLTAGLGFTTWATVNYYLDHSISSPYTRWAILFGIATVVFVGLAFGGGILAFASLPARTSIGLACAMLFLCAYHIHTAGKYASKNPKERSNAHATIGYKIAHHSFTLVKILLLSGCLLLSFLSIAALFNLSGLGGFSHLMTLAFNTIVNVLGPTSYAVGSKWFAAFSMGIFSIASFSAFELFKNLVKQSPKQTTGQLSEQMKLLVQIGKLVLVAGIIIVLTAMPGAFVMGGALTSMLPVFLVVATLMPLFSGNANIPYFKSFNDWFNEYLGLKPFSTGQEPWLYVRREFTVLGMLALLAVVAYIVSGAALINAGPALALGVATTMGFRWVTIWHNQHDPDHIIATAQDAIEGAPTDLPAETTPTRPPGQDITRNAASPDSDSKAIPTDPLAGLSPTPRLSHPLTPLSIPSGNLIPIIQSSISSTISHTVNGQTSTPSPSTSSFFSNKRNPTPTSTPQVSPLPQKPGQTYLTALFHCLTE